MITDESSENSDPNSNEDRASVIFGPIELKLSAGFGNIPPLNSLDVDERKAFKIVHSMFSTESISVVPFTKLFEFLLKQNIVDRMWLTYFKVLCIFLDKEILKAFVYAKKKHNGTTHTGLLLPIIKSCSLIEKPCLDHYYKRERCCRKRHHEIISDKTQTEDYNCKKIRFCSSADDVKPESIPKTLFFTYFTQKLKKVQALHSEWQKENSNNSQLYGNNELEKEFYELIGLRYTYCTKQDVEKATESIKHIFCDFDIFNGNAPQIINELEEWCKNRLDYRIILSKIIVNSGVNDGLKSILKISLDAADYEVQAKCNSWLDFISYANTLTDYHCSSNETQLIYTACKRLSSAKLDWINIKNEERKKQEDEERSKQLKEERYNELMKKRIQLQYDTISFILNMHSKQSTENYNPFWILGVDPRTTTLSGIKNIRKQLLLLVHPDKVLDSNLKDLANEASILVKSAVDSILNMFSNNYLEVSAKYSKGPNSPFSFGAKINRDDIKENSFDLFFKVIDIYCITLNGEISLPLNLEVKIYLKDGVTKIPEIRLYIAFPFIGKCKSIRPLLLKDRIFRSLNVYFDENDTKDSVKGILYKDYIHCIVPDVILIGYPGITELTYFVGIQIHNDNTDIFWNSVSFKVPPKTEFSKGFSKQKLRTHLESYRRTWGSMNKHIQIMYGADVLCHLVHNTQKKADLLEILFNVMENSYKYNFEENK
ncbi:DnaJ domain-containing protein [Cryptosporidium muris RN66]|uniref:DnaJ domain-containing protein n=1 Tax=Cryptosporidium muris (strain RN66) TaxID=441375 RepID=B6AD36_CRYMR|nr:DnaJ domain-containing protein [Cryptosporidium muris RN66]EEA06040.1 DnaJ domain-containing protein [Cryptosporidium muris RN66]|eukprot:XP_002140389.1 DnaJ domain-containing protein [Cryptosporidium muris RN66]